MPTLERLDTHQKALSLNLDPTIFGSFAEIGAGQEVARWFLRVGGASGTVAKTISAYDREVSDHLYGVETRYVSKQRLRAMLESEWAQLMGQLHASRGTNTKFFSFVDTISARNYAGTNDCHGWLGLRFLREPSGVPSDVILHVNLRDRNNLAQQEAVGAVGVNLIYAAYHALGSAEEFLANIFEGLGLHRLEMDCMDFSGPSFESWDQNEIHALLVAGGYAEAVVFPDKSQLVPPNELFYKRALVLAPGRFNEVNQSHAYPLGKTLAQLEESSLRESKGALGLFCLSLVSAIPECSAALVKHIVKHVEMLRGAGYGVIVFRAQELYAMTAFANRYTNSRVHFAIGLSILVRVFEDRYKDLSGALLEGIARLFTQNVRVTVYPMAAMELARWAKAESVTEWHWRETNGWVSVENLHPSGPLDLLYQFLLSSKFIVPGNSPDR